MIVRSAMIALVALGLGTGACAAKVRGGGARGIALDCRLSGAEASPLGEAEFCAQVRDALALQLNRPVLLASDRAATGLADRVDVRLAARPLRLRANVTVVLGGKRVTVPELGVNVIDRTLVRSDCKSISTLIASEVARLQK